MWQMKRLFPPQLEVKRFVRAESLWEGGAFGTFRIIFQYKGSGEETYLSFVGRLCCHMTEKILTSQIFLKNHLMQIYCMFPSEILW